MKSSTISTTVDCLRVSRLIHKSRFEGDTEAARYRQIAFLNMIGAETAMGRRPTVADLALSVGSTAAEGEHLAEVMEARGLVARTRVPTVSNTAPGMMLSIRADAAEAFSRAHIDAGCGPLLSAE